MGSSAPWTSGRLGGALFAASRSRSVKPAVMTARHAIAAAVVTKVSAIARISFTQRLSTLRATAAATAVRRHSVGLGGGIDFFF
jgi:hypothetical protein